MIHQIALYVSDLVKNIIDIIYRYQKLKKYMY